MRGEPEAGRTIGVGTHIVECLRINNLIERHGEGFLARVFSAEEIRYCSSRTQATQQYAAFWAAKEATVRALQIEPPRGMSWKTVELQMRGSGNPTPLLHGPLRLRAEQLGIRAVRISLSHCRTHAVAFAVALG
ncbi:MAG TPA: holo-ACP synthase [Pirellulaceae bacterium]|jgi:holo-[acyl-carrier protein] synthase|nr:holo-ACP synthase [Pirellulaceae bacterium]